MVRDVASPSILMPWAPVLPLLNMGNTSTAMRVVSIELPKELDEQLSEIARRRNASRSAILREALEAFARGSNSSVAEVARDPADSLKGPPALSSNPKYLDGYGKPVSRSRWRSRTGASYA